VKHRYVDEASGATARLCSNRRDGWIIEMIDVPVEHRSKGVGRELLRRITADADAGGVTLYLVISPDRGGLTEDQLAAWYRRHGFVERSDIGYAREPRQKGGASCASR
jgi:GNAT superfamily N-acetyltransferase